MVDLQDDVAQLVTALKELPELRSVVTEPDQLNAPGVYIRADGLALDMLAAYTVRCAVHLVVPDTGTDRALKALSDMLNAVRPVLDTFGGPEPDVQLVGLTLPGSQTPLPTLVVQQLLNVTES